MVFSALQLKMVCVVARYIIYFIPAYNNRYVLVYIKYVCTVYLYLSSYIINVYIEGVTRSLIHC